MIWTPPNQEFPDPPLESNITSCDVLLCENPGWSLADWRMLLAYNTRFSFISICQWVLVPIRCTFYQPVYSCPSPQGRGGCAQATFYQLYAEVSSNISSTRRSVSSPEEKPIPKLSLDINFICIFFMNYYAKSLFKGATVSDVFATSLQWYLEFYILNPLLLPNQETK